MSTNRVHKWRANRCENKIESRFVEVGEPREAYATIRYGIVEETDVSIRGQLIRQDATLDRHVSIIRLPDDETIVVEFYRGGPADLSSLHIFKP